MNFKDFTITLLQDIRFWIIAFFLLHLSSITLPPLEPGSNWRQTDGLMVARNFYEVDSNIFYPRVDVGGDKTGIVGCEFPVLNYLIYLVSLVFGYESWYGRLINLIVSSFGVFFFFKLIRDHFSKPVAFNSAILVLVSIWFTYNRTNIPDTFGASLCLISLYYGIQYLESGGVYRLLLFLVFGWFGCMAKISSACLLTVLAIPFFSRSVLWSRRIWVSAASVIILGSVYAWYFVWVPHLTAQYGFEGHFFMGMSLSDGAQQILAYWKTTLKRFYDTAFKFIGFFVFLMGMYLVIRKKYWLHLLVFAIPFTAFLLVVIKSGYNFQLNPYYVIMFIPPMAFIAGTGLELLNKKLIVVIALVAVAAEGIGNQIHIFRIRQPYESLTSLEGELDKIGSRNDKIVINATCFGDPTPMYFAHRKGWSIATKEFNDPAFRDQFESMGFKYAVVVKKMYGDVQLDLPEVYSSEYFRIYKIQ
jgi:hypothetical protein